jgi:hypothetical protein
VVGLSVSCRETGLHRTSLDRWKVVDCPEVRARIEIPDGAKLESSAASGMSVLLHPVADPLLDFRDVRHQVTLHITRKTVAAMDDDLRLLKQIVPPTRENRWKYWGIERHPRVDRWASSGDGSANYRYDLECPVSDVLSAEGELVYGRNGGSEHSDEDDGAIRKMLGSLRCVPVTGDAR